MEEDQNKNLFTPILVGLLVIAAFFVGMFYTKVQTMKTVKDDDNVVVVGEEVENAPAAEEKAVDTVVPTVEGITSFDEVKDAEICMEDGKPVIYLFSTTTCPHCTWVGDTFDSVVNEYVNAGQIVAYHWELDKNDNTLTAEVESQVPAEQRAIYEKLGGGYVPTFIIGCKYFRVGNGHESEDDLVAEAAELRAAIDAVLQ